MLLLLIGINGCHWAHILQVIMIGTLCEKKLEFFFCIDCGYILALVTRADFVGASIKSYLYGLDYKEIVS